VINTQSNTHTHTQTHTHTHILFLFSEWKRITHRWDYSVKTDLNNLDRKTFHVPSFWQQVKAWDEGL